MSPTTRFLSKFFGLFLLITALAMLLDAPGMAATVALFIHDRPAMLLLGFMCLGAGLATVLVHPAWSGGAASVCVTLLGWMTLGKGLASLLLPPVWLEGYAGAVVGPGLYDLSGVITLVLGAFLTYAGFSAAAIVSTDR